jgi:hypothetical protein
MKFNKDQLEQYNTEGYVIFECPFRENLTNDCMAAVEKVRLDDPEEVMACDGRRNHYRLKPQIPGSYWCDLDHSLPFLKVILHEEIVELARQLIGEEDIYLRNAGINEQAPNRSTLWHRDGGPVWAEFMHYFSGAKCEDGCLRVVPGSQYGPIEPWKDLLEQQRKERDVTTSPGVDGFEDAELPEEISLEVDPHHMIVRFSQILHATWLNRSDKGRCMSHWLFHPHDRNNHRFNFNEYLTPELVDSLDQDQKDVLWLDRDFELDPNFAKERESELGKVMWGVV